MEDELLPISSSKLNLQDVAWVFAAIMSSSASPALAKGGELGILEGRTAALVHPLAMFLLLATTVYSGYLGWQWRRIRTIGDDIAKLKSEIAALPIPATEGGTPPPPPPQAAKIEELKETRKIMMKAGYRDKHFNTGSILLGTGILFSIEGAMNTYTRVGKLFPGPHLFAGAGMTALWALSAALVPAMQKGNDAARNAHIALNAANVMLFIWQVPTGLEIVGKVFQFTSWP